MRNHVLPAIGRIPLATIAASDLDNLYARKLAEGLSPQSVHHIHATVHAALALALRRDKISRNVADQVDPPRGAPREMTPSARRSTAPSSVRPASIRTTAASTPASSSALAARRPASLLRWAASATVSITRWPRASSRPWSASSSTANGSARVTRRGRRSSTTSRPGTTRVDVTRPSTASAQWTIKGGARRRSLRSASDRPRKRGKSTRASPGAGEPLPSLATGTARPRREVASERWRREAESPCPVAERIRPAALRAGRQSVHDLLRTTTCRQLHTIAVK